MDLNEKHILTKQFLPTSPAPKSRKRGRLEYVQFLHNNGSLRVMEEASHSKGFFFCSDSELPNDSLEVFDAFTTSKQNNEHRVKREEIIRD